jgi:uncharacterized RmlC-like cupin family protein
MRDKHGDLAKLFAPVSLERFAHEYWAHQVFYSPAALGTHELREYDCRDSLEPMLQGELSLQMLEAQLRNQKAKRYITDAAEIGPSLRLEESLQLRQLQRVLPPTAKLSRLALTLETFLGHPLDSISLFISPPGVQAIKEHHDLTEMFTLQVEGTKTWTIYPHGEQPISVTLGPGALLYVPAYVRHKVVSNSTTSVSYALVYRPLRVDAVLAELVRHALPAAVGRLTLPAVGTATDEAANASRLPCYLSALRDTLASVAWEQIAHEARVLGISQAKRCRSNLLLPLVNVDENAPLQRSSLALAAVAVVDDRLIVSLPGWARVELPVCCEYEVRTCLGSSTSFTAVEVAQNLTPSETVLVLQTFVECGLLVPAAADVPLDNDTSNVLWSHDLVPRSRVGAIAIVRRRAKYSRPLRQLALRDASAAIASVGAHTALPQEDSLTFVEDESDPSPGTVFLPAFLQPPLAGSDIKIVWLEEYER